MFQKKSLILAGLIFVGGLHVFISANNTEGHDFGVYSENMKADRPNDLILSWLIMKLFTNLFGNPKGLYYLSYLIACILYLMYVNKIEDVDRKIAFTIFFFSVYPIWYMSSGLLRNLLGLCFLSGAILYQGDDRELTNAFILINVHIPTFFVYVAYEVYKADIPRWEMIVQAWACVLYSMIVGGAVVGGIAVRSIEKPVTLLLMKVKRPLDFYIIEWVGLNVQAYAVILLVASLWYFYDSVFKEDTNWFWMVLLILPVLPLFNYTIRFRFLLFTIIPMLNIKFTNKGLIAMGIFSAVARVAVYLL